METGPYRTAPHRTVPHSSVHHAFCCPISEARASKHVVEMHCVMVVRRRLIVEVNDVCAAL